MASLRAILKPTHLGWVVLSTDGCNMVRCHRSGSDEHLHYITPSYPKRLIAVRPRSLPAHYISRPTTQTAKLNLEADVRRPIRAYGVES